MLNKYKYILLVLNNMLTPWEWGRTPGRNRRKSAALIGGGWGRGCIYIFMSCQMNLF